MLPLHENPAPTLVRARKNGSAKPSQWPGMANLRPPGPSYSFTLRARPLAPYSALAHRTGFRDEECRRQACLSRVGPERTLWTTRNAVGIFIRGGKQMIWTKPEFKEVAVTLEVTAYAARR